MKTPEDEAFEDIERRQGGFQAKRQMAADKFIAAEERKTDEDAIIIQYHEETIKRLEKRIEELLAQPAQEPPAQKCPNIKNCGGACFQCEYFNAEKGEMEYPVVQPPLPVQPEAFTTGHCQEKAKPGGCQLHNIHCGFPDCDRKKS